MSYFCVMMERAQACIKYNEVGLLDLLDGVMERWKIQETKHLEYSVSDNVRQEDEIA